MTEVNPYPGLRPFEQCNAGYFFGRESQVDDLVMRLGQRRFLAVTGSSGCGKSSLVRAGLLSALQAGLLAKAGSRWRIAILRPGLYPVQSLAEAVGQAFGSSGLEQTLRRSSLGLREAVKQARLGTSENVLVVVDQFEELFNHRESRDEPIAFVRLLMEGVRQAEAPIYVVITLRSEFFADCAELQDLPEALNDGVYLVPRMKRDQLRAAIGGPPLVDGDSVTPSLVQRVMNDLYEHPDYLPVLQNALRRTWEAWRQSDTADPIGVVYYEMVGGLRALDRYADEVLFRLHPPLKDIAKKVFQRLTYRGHDNRVVRRPTRVAELCAVAGAPFGEVLAAVDRFREAMLLVPDIHTALGLESICDLTHESLMRQWQNLAQWIEEEAEAATIYRRLEDIAVRYNRGDASLLSGLDLKSADAWAERTKPHGAWALRYGEHFDQVVRLIADSKKADFKKHRWRLFGVGG